MNGYTPAPEGSCGEGVMSEDAIQAIRFGFTALAVSLWLGGAWCVLLARGDAERAGRARALSVRWWEALDGSAWGRLPERVVGGLHRLIAKAILNPDDFPAPSTESFRGFLGIVTWFGPGLIALVAGLVGQIFLLTVAGGVGVILVLGGAWQGRRWSRFSSSKRRNRAASSTQVIGMGAMAAFTFASIPVVLERSTIAALVLTVLSLPMIFMAEFLFLALPTLGGHRSIEYSRSIRRTIGAVATGVALSLPITLTALLLGSVAAPDAYVPQTTQMVAANVMFDALTLVVTLDLLGWAVARSSRWRIPVAVGADLAIAAGFAVASLVLGLAFTDTAIGWGGAANVLLARAPGGEGWDVGPYFWAMHTAFLPTLAFLGLVLLGFVAKAMLSLAKRYLNESLKSEHPLDLLAALFALVAGAAWGARELVGFIPVVALAEVVGGG